MFCYFEWKPLKDIRQVCKKPLLGESDNRFGSHENHLILCVFISFFFLSAIAQVVEGGGEMDITFQVISPSGALVVDDQKKTDDLHTVQVNEKGVYAFCFDNSFSTLAEKTVYADLGLESDDIDNWLSELEGDKSIEDQQLQVESLRVLLLSIRVYFTQ